jgi:hypothetical protein
MRLGQPDLFTKRVRKLPLALEFETQCAVVKTFEVSRVKGWIMTAFPAGELRDKATAGRLKAMGLKPGFFDLLLIDSAGQHYWLEMKRGNAPLNDDQQWFEGAMIERGIPHAIARSYEQAIAVLKAWGAVRVAA